jgi:mono/diheme cytochrome c family protein
MTHHRAIVPGLFVMPLLFAAGCRSDAAPTPPEVPAVAAASDLEAGRYLVEIGGCNDCHSVGYIEADGALPDSLWLTGSPVGFRGPWGTSYAKNLRLTTHQLTEEQWVARLQAGGLPPMPWPSVRALSDADARAIYRFVRSLGPAGELAPRPVGPDAEPVTPYLDLVPQHLDRLAAPADSAAS